MMNKADSSPGKKILFIGHEASCTGAPILLLHLLQWLKVNSQVQFEILLKRGGPLADDFAALAPTTILNTSRLENLVWRICRKLGINPPKKFSLPEKAVKFAQNRKISLLYANTVAVGEEVEALSKLGVPLVWHLHEMPFVIQLYKGEKAIRNAVRQGCDFIAASEGVRQGLMTNYAVPADKIQVINAFVGPGTNDPQTIQTNRRSVREELGLPQDVFVAGMCGVVGWRKGADLFIATAKHLATEFTGKNIYLLWIGGPESQAVQNQVEFDVRQAGLAKRVLFIGFKTDTARYLAALDAFVLPSREDPFPLVMLEAATLAIPTVCFNHSGGGPEFVEKDAGIIVEYADTLAAARALVQLSEQPALCRQLGATAQQKVASRYTVEIQARKIIHFVEQLMESSGAKRL